MAKDIEVTVPDIGDYQDVPVIEVLVKPGDRVEKDSSLLTLESDKATLDVPAPQAGIVGELRIKVGDRVSKGAAVLTLRSDDAAAAAPPVPAATPAAPAAAPAPAPAASAAPKAEAPQAAPAASPSGSGAVISVTVPDIGDYHDVPVIELLVKDGDTVEKDAPLVTLESDKATMDVPAPAAGVVRGLKLKLGDRLSKGAAVCELVTASAAAAPVAAPESPSAPPSAPPSVPESAPAAAPAAAAPAVAAPAPAAVLVAPGPGPGPGPGGELPHASPSIRKFARELGVDLAKVSGRGPRGRITRDDVQDFVKRALHTPAPASPSIPAAGSGIPPIPAVDFSQFGPIETKPLARIRKLSAAHLHRSWLNIPHVTQQDEADITELEAFRKSSSDELAASGGAKLTLLPFIIKAAEKALKQYPEFNASLSPDGESLILKNYFHIGFAADTPNGLVVPVIRDVDKKGIAQLGNECADLARKARDGKLKPDDMKGGNFSISSLGGIGGSYFTPIVNAPEVAILGVSRAVMKPVWDGKQFQPRLMVPLSLSYDHRVIDGAAAARFIVLLVKLLSDVRRLTL